MKQLSSVAALTLLGACLAFYSGRIAFVAWAQASQGTVLPYVMTYDQFGVANNTETLYFTVTESRRRDGSVHRAGASHADANNYRHVELADGTVLNVIDAVRGKSTTQREAEAVKRLRTEMLNPPRNCLLTGEQLDGEEMLLGVRAMRITRDEENGKRSLQWRLPDFNCISAQKFLQERATPQAPWLTINGNRLRSFLQKDPDVSLFSDWKTYEELKPSDLYRKHFRSMGLTPAQCQQCFADRPEDEYYRTHPSVQR